MTAAISIPENLRKKKKDAQPPREVVVVTHYFGAHGGGIERVAERLVRETAEVGNLHFTWFASDCDAPADIAGQDLVPVRAFNGFEKFPGLPLPIWSPSGLKRLRRAVQKADVVWLHDTLYMGNLFAFACARKAKKPIVITQHIAPIPYRNPLLRWAMRLADKLFTARMLKKAEEVIFISDRVAEDYYGRVAFTRSIKVIPNGVDGRIFQPAIPENRRFLREQFALKNKQPVLLFVGRFVEKKGLEVVRRMAAQMPAYRFWMAGDGPIQPEKWLLPNIHVFRGRSGPTLAELYQAADLLIIPSYGEGFPLVIQEAMACGLPVLCAPATAAGSRPAAPLLHTAEVWPDNPERTAAVWAEKIAAFPLKLPLQAPLEDVAEFARLSWDWRAIAGVYADIFKGYGAKSNG